MNKNIRDDYNGWENRESWGVALMIDNEEKLYNMAYKAAERPGQDAESLALYLRDYVEEQQSDYESLKRYAVELLGQQYGITADNVDAIEFLGDDQIGDFNESMLFIYRN